MNELLGLLEQAYDKRVLDVLHVDTIDAEQRVVAQQLAVGRPASHYVRHVDARVATVMMRAVDVAAADRYAIAVVDTLMTICRIFQTIDI